MLNRTDSLNHSQAESDRLEESRTGLTPNSVDLVLKSKGCAKSFRFEDFSWKNCSINQERTIVRDGHVGHVAVSRDGGAGRISPREPRQPHTEVPGFLACTCCAGPCGGSHIRSRGVDPHCIGDGYVEAGPDDRLAETSRPVSRTLLLGESHPQKTVRSIVPAMMEEEACLTDRPPLPQSSGDCRTDELTVSMISPSDDDPDCVVVGQEIFTLDAPLSQERLVGERPQLSLAITSYTAPP